MSYVCHTFERVLTQLSKTARFCTGYGYGGGALWCNGAMVHCGALQYTAQCLQGKVEIPPGCQRREMAQISGLEYDETYFFPGANNPEENTFLNVFLSLKL